MKFLIVGLGSMGKRRVRNLTALRAGTILGFDPRADRRREAEEKYGITTFDDFDAAMAENPDALVISTPPDLHIRYGLLAARAGKHFFMEASVVDEGLAELIDLCRHRNLVAAPSCTMRFQPSVRLIKDLLAANRIGKVLAATHHCGQYLPDWHPWEDYRAYYVSRRETGACREIVPFELVWLTWLLGPVRQVSAMKAKTSNLDADIDDVYQVLLEFEQGALGHLLVDVVARAPVRHLRLMGEEGVIKWDASAKLVKLYQAETGNWQVFPEAPAHAEAGYLWAEAMYIDEMRHFTGAIQGTHRWDYSLEEDAAVLRTLYAAEASAEEGKHRAVAPNPVAES